MKLGRELVWVKPEVEGELAIKKKGPEGQGPSKTNVYLVTMLH